MFLESALRHTSQATARFTQQAGRECRPGRAGLLRARLEPHMGETPIHTLVEGGRGQRRQRTDQASLLKDWQTVICMGAGQDKGWRKATQGLQGVL